MGCELENMSYVDKVKLIAQNIENLTFNSTNWSNNLAPTDDTLQEVFDKLDLLELDNGDGGSSAPSTPSTEVDTIADLRSYAFIVNSIKIKGYHEAGDTDIPPYKYVQNSVKIPNLGSVIAHQTGVGNWERIDVGYAHVEWDGARGDGTTPDSVSIQETINDNKNVIFDGNSTYAIDAALTMKKQFQRFTGIGTKLLATNGNNIFEITTEWLEQLTFKGLHFDSETPGVGVGIYGINSKYFASTTVIYCHFYASLAICLEVNLVLCDFNNCTFGTYGTAGATHMHIKSLGQQLDISSALTVGANTFRKCFFRKAKGVDYASVFANGYKVRFSGCDLEVNEPTKGMFRFQGIRGVSFDSHTWSERNKGEVFADFELDTTGTLQASDILQIDSCWLKLESENEGLIRSSNSNFSMSFTNNAGTGFAGGKYVNKANTSVDFKPCMTMWYNNSLVGYTGSYPNTPIGTYIHKPNFGSLASSQIDMVGASSGALVGKFFTSGVGTYLDSDEFHQRAKDGTKRYKMDATKFMAYNPDATLGHPSYYWNKLYTKQAIVDRSSAKETALVSNLRIDFKATNNFDTDIVVAGALTISLDATCIGQGGVIFVRNSQNINAYPTQFKWEGGVAPTLTGLSTISYYIKSETFIVCSAISDLS